MRERWSHEAAFFEYDQFSRRVGLQLEFFYTNRSQYTDDRVLGPIHGHALGSAAEHPTELRGTDYRHCNRTGRKVGLVGPSGYIAFAKTAAIGATRSLRNVIRFDCGAPKAAVHRMRSGRRIRPEADPGHDRR